MLGRGGKISWVRVASIIAVLGILVVAAGIVSFFLDQNSHKAPLDIDLYPGAVNIGQKTIASTTRREFFRVNNATPEEVSAFYDQKLTEFEGEHDDTCIRTPPQGDLDTSSVANAVPYEYICMFDRSGFRTSQYTKVTIQPGLYNANASLNYAGSTIVQYDQYWQP